MEISATQTYSSDGHQRCEAVGSLCLQCKKKASGSIDSTSTEVATDLYVNKILKRNDDPNAHVFFADIKKRDKATVDKVSRLFG